MADKTIKIEVYRYSPDDGGEPNEPGFDGGVAATEPRPLKVSH